MAIPDYLSTPFGYRVQKTISAPITFTGIGLHCGKNTKIQLLPAEPNEGIYFFRVDLKNARRIPAHFDSVVATDLATTLGVADREEERVGTVEHLLASLFAIGITNVRVEVDGPEIPILDGSASPFVDALVDTGVTVQPFSTATLKIYRPVRVAKKGAICELLPRDRLRLTTSIEFAHPEIGLQTYAMDLTPVGFQKELCSARTFGFLQDLELLKKHNLAQGASLENVLAFSETGTLNPELRRYRDECVRHKVLDAVGDLALCGCWIEGEMLSYRGGHSMHRLLLQTLAQYPGHWERLPPEPLPAMVFEKAPGAFHLPSQVEPNAYASVLSLRL